MNLTHNCSLIVDTNSLYDSLGTLKKLLDNPLVQLIIPRHVLLELARHKKKPRLRGKVLRAIEFIAEAGRRIRILASDAVLSDDLMSDTDNLILDEVFAECVREPVLATHDRLFQLAAKSRGIPSYPLPRDPELLPLAESVTGVAEDCTTGIPVNHFTWVDGLPVFHGPAGERPLAYTHRLWGLAPRSAYQNMAMDLLLNPGLDLVSLQSAAGYGKTYLALAAALELVFQQKESPYNRIILATPLVSAGEDMGFLPGNVAEKISPYTAHITDLLMKLHLRRPANRMFIDPKAKELVLNPRRVTFKPLAFMRGDNIDNAVVVADEVQNYTRSHMRTLLTRMGKNVKCFCLGDNNQVDTKGLDRHNNGMNWMVTKLNGQPGYAHFTLKGKHSRGPITDMVLACGL